MMTTVPMPFPVWPNDDDLGWLSITDGGNTAVLDHDDDLLVVSGYQRSYGELVVFGIEALFAGELAAIWEWDTDGRFVRAKVYRADPDAPPCECSSCIRRRRLSAEALYRRAHECGDVVVYDGPHAELMSLIADLTPEQQVALRAGCAFGPQMLPEG